MGGRTLLVNGQKTDHVVKAEAEARRVQARLHELVGAQVQPLIALVGVKDLTVRTTPKKVAVQRADRLVRYLVRRPAVLDESQCRSALERLNDTDSFDELDDHVTDLAWFNALRREVEAAKVRRVLLTALGLVIAGPVFLTVATRVLPPVLTALLGLLLPR